MDVRPSSLSGGELRRAELALALARRPRCLLADEPFRGIAPVDHDLLSDIFRGMAAEGCAVVVTGHEVATLLALAHHVTWCVSATTYELGSPEAAMKHEAFQREYAASAKDAGAWQAFFGKYLSLDDEAAYQRAVASFAQRAEGERRPAGAR